MSVRRVFEAHAEEGLVVQHEHVVVEVCCVLFSEDRVLATAEIAARRREVRRREAVQESLVPGFQRSEREGDYIYGSERITRRQASAQQAAEVYVYIIKRF